MSVLWALAINNDNVITAKEQIDKDDEIGSNYANVVEGVGTTANVYYFGSSDDGAMKTGNQTIEIDGDTYQFSFGKSGESKGKGLKVENNNVFYIYGKKVKADADYRYQGVDEDDGTLLVGNDAKGHYLIITSGSIMKGSKYTDSESRIYTLDANNHKVLDWT